MKTKEQLEKKLADLQVTHDQLIAELCYVDQLMRNIGFPNGIVALKETAHEFYGREGDYLDEIA